MDWVTPCLRYCQGGTGHTQAKQDLLFGFRNITVYWKGQNTSDGDKEMCVSKRKKEVCWQQTARWVQRTGTFLKNLKALEVFRKGMLCTAWRPRYELESDLTQPLLAGWWLTEHSSTGILTGEKREPEYRWFAFIYLTLSSDFYLPFPFHIRHP